MDVTESNTNHRKTDLSVRSVDVVYGLMQAYEQRGIKHILYQPEVANMHVLTWCDHRNGSTPCIHRYEVSCVLLCTATMLSKHVHVRNTHTP